MMSNRCRKLNDESTRLNKEIKKANLKADFAVGVTERREEEN